MSARHTTNEPGVSVIIPSHNCRNVLARVLEGLEHQDFDRFEVIVIDDGSDDGTAEWLATIKNDRPFGWHLLKTAGLGPAVARNQGAKQAQGEIFLFLDADTIPNPDLVRRHWEVHQRHAGEDVCIMGKVAMAPELMKLDQIRWNEHDLPCQPNDVIKVNHLKYRTPNSSVSRALFTAAGGFHSGLIASEDLELAFRLADRGVHFYYYDDIVAEHYHPLNLSQYIEKSKTYGKALAYWYCMSPELHPQLARRFGLYHPSLSFGRKLRYVIKRLMINQFTIDLITMLAGGLRKKYFGLSDRLYKAMFGYYLRREFRVSFHTALCVLGIYC
ncbi:glycosyltransferase family 2 protein [candidate division KSB1 bacterium]|nr:glycosyltransferase family 2 protein [candidate division KSB1 bacterium]